MKRTIVLSLLLALIPLSASAAQSSVVAHYMTNVDVTDAGTDTVRYWIKLFDENSAIVAMLEFSPSMTSGVTINYTGSYPIATYPISQYEVFIDMLRHNSTVTVFYTEVSGGKRLDIGTFYEPVGGTN